MTLWKWSKTAANNANSDSTINWAENQAPSSVNNSSRAEMAAVAKARDDWSGMLNTGGSLTAYTISSNQNLTALTDGFRIAARVHTSSGASPTLSVDSLTAKAIRTHTDEALPTGALNSGGIYTFTYDSGDDCWYVHGYFNPSVISVQDSTFSIFDESDETKILQFQLSGITTGNTRTLSIPDADGTILTDTDLGDTVQDHSARLDDIAGLAVTDNNFIVGNGSNWVAESAATARISLGGILASGVFPGALVAIIEDRKSQNTSPQSLSTGANTRDLNTLAYNRNTTVSLASNRFTLPAGTWEIAWSAPVGANNFSRRHQTYLYNFTDSAEAARGDTGASTSTSDNGMAKGISVGSAVVTIASAKAFEIRHFTNGSMGGGDSANDGTEVYTRVSVRAA